MAVSKMLKIRVVGVKKDKDVILDALQKMGALELLETTYGDDGKGSKAIISNTEYDFAGVKFALAFLSKFSTEKISLRDKISGTKINVKESEFSGFLNSYPYKDIVARTQDIEAGINKAKSQVVEMTEKVAKLKPWKNLDHPLIKETKTSKAIFALVSEKKHKILVKELNNLKFSHIQVVNKIEKNLYLEIIFNKKDKKIDILFDRLGIEKKEVPCCNLSPKEATNVLSLKIKEVKKREEELYRDARNLSKETKNLRIAFDILSSKKNQEDAWGKIYQTEKTFILTAWIENIFLTDIISKIQKISNSAVIETLDVMSKEERPIVIRNSSFWSPFESVTGIYGLPKYNEIDPTPILAPFFILFFALCLTDAGYGIVLMLLSFIAIKILKVPKPAHKLLRLLGYGGFVTFLIGGLFGGWFGIDVNSLPPIIRNLQLINPVENPILVLIIALALGVVQIITALTVAFYWKAKTVSIKEAVLDHGTWVLFLVAICLFAGTQFGLIPLAYLGLVTTLLYLGLAAVVFAGGRKQKNPLMKVVAGVGSLYGLIGYLSDVLSYSRLLALGLATGIIAMVVNMIAELGGSVPYVGPLLFVLILIFGHTFNIAINTLGSFIHSGRLQFVEFFPKFMDGGGRRFSPLKRDLKYVDIVNK
jgi:V/A-type H+-transporting ATPase subunit I